MARVDTIQHTFRVNLNNPKHLLVHQTLVNLNLDIHKSRANFIIECLYKIIQGTEIQELTNIADEDREKLVTKREVMKMNDELKDEIEKEVMEKVTSMLFGAMVGNVNVGNVQMVERKEAVVERAELYIDKVSCTLFSLNEEINDNIMGKQGSTKLILENIELLIKYNIDVEVKTVLMNSNVFEYKDIVKYCQARGINHVVSVNVTKKFLEDDANVKLRVRDDELEKIFLDESLGLLKKNNVLDIDYICEKLRYSLFINSEGNVYPCDTFSESCGNIKQQRLHEIWNNSGGLKHYRNLTMKQLNSCKNCNKKKYCFKCPGITQLEEGNIDKPSILACQHANVRYKLLKEAL